MTSEEHDCERLALCLDHPRPHVYGSFLFSGWAAYPRSGSERYTPSYHPTYEEALAEALAMTEGAP